MKSKAPLALMEQLVMVLVFALAAALCVQAFFASDRMSRQGEARDRAVLLAQNTAEYLKEYGKEYGAEQTAQTLAQALGGTAETPERVCVYLDGELSEDRPAPENAAYLLRVELEDAQCGGRLGRAEISVYQAGAAEPLFSIPAAWQEGEDAQA